VHKGALHQGSIFQEKIVPSAEAFGRKDSEMKNPSIRTAIELFEDESLLIEHIGVDESVEHDINSLVLAIMESKGEVYVSLQSIRTAFALGYYYGR
jgi:hypothetical protein